jgi:ribosome-associated heat shock protein Hsp15
MKKVRIDKWLWSVRIFKSRTLATDACKGGKVKVGGSSIKPSYLLGEGEVVVVRKNGFNFEFQALQLIEKRVGAAIAVTCYTNVTPEEEKQKYEAWFINATRSTEARAAGTGRPTKKERREMDEFKEWDFEDMDDES